MGVGVTSTLTFKKVKQSPSLVLSFCFQVLIHIFLGLFIEDHTGSSYLCIPGLLELTHTLLRTFWSFWLLTAYTHFLFLPLLDFIEHLVELGISHPTICNKLSALKFMFTRFHWPTQIFDSSILSRTLRVIDISVPRVLKSKEIFSIQDLTNLIHLTLSHAWGLVWKPLFLLVSFAFLRIDNHLPQSAYHSASHYTSLRRDVVFKDNIATISLRYTKSGQSWSTLTHVQVPTLHGAPLSFWLQKRKFATIFLWCSKSWLLRHFMFFLTQTFQHFY